MHIQGDSNELTPHWFSERSIPYFRLLSIDASHDLKLVLRDFNLAACLMMDGGIVIAGGVFHHQGHYSWLHALSRPECSPVVSLLTSLFSGCCNLASMCQTANCQPA